MTLTSLLLVLSLSALCSSQTDSSSSLTAASSSTNAAVTVTSTLAIIILPPSSNTTNSSSSAPSTSNASSTLTPAPTLTSTSFALPTVPYTGQPLLVGTCDIPEYTALPFPDGSMLEVPLIGCCDERPDCCPSLELSSVSQPATTNVVSLLNQAPLDICPKDFVQITEVCCPSGYRLYGQAIVGQTPCYTELSSTVSPPQTVLASISSAAAATISAKSTTAAVSIIINQVFALSLPCGPYADDDNYTELSTADKAGIGVGAGVGGLILVTLAIRFCLIYHRRRQRKQAQAQMTAATPGPLYGGLPAMTNSRPYPSFPPGASHTGYAVSPEQASPASHQMGFEQHNRWTTPMQPQPQPGHTSVSSDSLRPYDSSSPVLPPGYAPERPAFAPERPAFAPEMPAELPEHGPPQAPA